MKVHIRGISGELEKLANDALTIKPNFAYTLEEVRATPLLTANSGSQPQRR